jgi:hypothetical protein
MMTSAHDATTCDATDVNLADLETRGFVVVPEFLSAADVRALCTDFEGQPIDERNKNYRITPVSRPANLWLRDRVLAILERIGRETNLKADLPQGGNYFATGARHGIKFDWHQDHESFFVLQNHYDYLNFYIPIVKPRREKSNLSIVPFDILQRESPRSYRRLFRNGATRFAQWADRPVALCDDTGTLHFLRKSLDSMAITPMLGAGDLLLMRGDVIHRTQDADTERVAMSYRVSSTSAVVSRRRLAAGGAEKARMMANNAALYERMFLAFDRAGRTELPIAEFGRAVAGVPPITARTRREFYRFLVREKLRSGVLGAFLFSLSVTSMLKASNRVSRRHRAQGGGS